MENLLYHRELSLKAFAVPDFITLSKNNGFITVFFFTFITLIFKFPKIQRMFWSFPGSGRDISKVEPYPEKKKIIFGVGVRNIIYFYA